MGALWTCQSGRSRAAATAVSKSRREPRRDLRAAHSADGGSRREDDRRGGKRRAGNRRSSFEKEVVTGITACRWLALLAPLSLRYTRVPLFLMICSLPPASLISQLDPAASIYIFATPSPPRTIAGLLGTAHAGGLIAVRDAKNSPVLSYLLRSTDNIFNILSKSQQVPYSISPTEPPWPSPGPPLPPPLSAITPARLGHSMEDHRR